MQGSRLCRTRAAYGTGSPGILSVCLSVCTVWGTLYNCILVVTVVVFVSYWEMYRAVKKKLGDQIFFVTASDVDQLLSVFSTSIFFNFTGSLLKHLRSFGSLLQIHSWIWKKNYLSVFHEYMKLSKAVGTFLGEICWRMATVQIVPL